MFDIPVSVSLTRFRRQKMINFVEADDDKLMN